MKLRTTTPASISRMKKSVLITFAFLLAFIAPIQIANNVSADRYDDVINALQQDISKYKAESDRLSSEAVTLQSTLAQLANQKAAIQTQINISQAKYEKLIAQIAETEKKIKENQDALGQTIANLYVEDKVTPIEMLASSSNIGDYLDKQEYRNSVREELLSTIGTVKDLKISLSKQKLDVEKILADQKSQRQVLSSKESEQSNLLAQTRGDEATYQKLIGDSQSKIDEARATQAAINSRYANSGGFTIINGGLLGDYPWNGNNCPMWGYLSTGGADGNGGDGRGYGCRQCASYVAWKIAKETNIYYNWGNAVDFTANAKANGYVEGAPSAGSIAVMDPGKAGQSYGHIAWVESNPYTNANGEQVIQISQYNYNYGQGYGMYSVMELSIYAFDHYVKIK